MDGENRMHGKERWLLTNTSNHASECAALFTFKKSYIFVVINNSYLSGPGSSVGIATGYRMDSPGIKFWRGEIFHTCPDQPWGPPSLLYGGYQVFPGGRKRMGHDNDSSPPSSAKV
jgi:hypothetical protein